MRWTGLTAALTAGFALLLAAGPSASVAQDPALPSAPLPYQPAPAAQAKAPPRPAARTARPPAATAQPAAPAPILAAVAPLDPAQLEAFVDGVITEEMSNHRIVGVTVSIVQNGQVVMKKGYGFDRLNPLRPVDPDRSLFRLASISKTFTWVALMRRVEAGGIKLDAPINLYLPEEARVPDQGFPQKIRVIDLMNHRTGFEDRIMGQLFEKDADRVRPMTLYLAQERPRREWAAGTRPAYSNYGVNLAGQAVAWQLQRPFADIVEQDIARPLGMFRTSFRDPYPPRKDLPAPMPAALAGDLSEGYVWAGTRWKKRPYEFASHVSAAGGGSSTAADMARWMMLLLNDGNLDGVSLYGPRTAQAFRTVTIRGVPGGPGVAHGFLEYRLPGGFVGYGHDGATLSFKSNMTTVPALGLGVFVAVNTESGSPLTAALASRIVGRFYAGGATTQPPRTSQWLKDNAGAFSGQYLSSRRSFHGLEKFLGLITSRTKLSVDGQGQLIINDFDGAGVWTPLDRTGRFKSAHDSRIIAFEMKDGRAVGYYGVGGVTYHSRAGFLQGEGWIVLFSALTLIAAIATLAGAVMRLRLNLRQTTVQSRASLFQSIQSTLWLITFGSFLIWFGDAGDTAKVVFGWPSPWMVLASACALVASVLSLVAVGLSPFVWQGGRRLDSWNVFRKVRFTMTAVIFLMFSIVLAVWGAIFPWAS